MGFNHSCIILYLQYVQTSCLEETVNLNVSSVKMAGNVTGLLGSASASLAGWDRSARRVSIGGIVYCLDTHSVQRRIQCGKVLKGE